MASRRIALSAALRAPSSPATGAPRVLRAAFSTAASRAPQTATIAAKTTRTAIAWPTVGRSSGARDSGLVGVRWSSDSPSGNKIWTFEEVQALTKRSPGSKPKVTLIDAREPSEVADTGKIPGALNVPISSAPDSFHVSADEFADRYGAPRPDPQDEDTELVFYCKAGVRSRAAATIAREAGYAKIGEYPGSWLDWVAKGGEVER